MVAHITSEFQAGGPLRETAVYVERPADRMLREHFARGECCHVFGTRQVGKTSLYRRTARALHDEQPSVRVVEFDLSTIGYRASEAEWFFTLAYLIAEQLDCEDGLQDFWSGHPGEPADRWELFLERYLPSREVGRVVLVVDEVSSVESLPFSCDDFFATIRSSEHRGDNGLLRARLSFCLVGCAAPEDLVCNRTRSPFEASHAVCLDDFSREETSTFLPRLRVALGERAEAFLEAIFDWTRGHPYMTQRLCALAASGEPDFSTTPAAQVALLVELAFTNEGRVLDPLLNYVDRFISKEQKHCPLEQMLALYRDVLEAEAPVRSNPESLPEEYLRLSGLITVVDQAGTSLLAPRNRVFSEVFDRRWIREKEPELRLGPGVFRWRNARPEDRKSHLLSGETLRRALEWAAGHDISPDEAKFLLESDLAARKAAEDDDEDEKRRSARLVTRGRSWGHDLVDSLFKRAARAGEESPAPGRSAGAGSPPRLAESDRGWVSGTKKCFVGYAREDERFARDLMRHLMPLQESGAISVWHPGDLTADRESTARSRLGEADVILFLVSADLFSDATMRSWIDIASKRARQGAQIVPVSTRPVDLKATTLGAYPPLPSTGEPISAFESLDEAYLDIVRSIQTMVAQRSAPAVRPPRDAPIVVRRIADIFSANATSESTYVPPAEMAKLTWAMEKTGGLVVHGPSGSGKTTAVKRLIPDGPSWINCIKKSDLERLGTILDHGEINGNLVLDEFHELDANRHDDVARFIKLCGMKAKIVIVGVSNSGKTLFSGSNNLAGRMEFIEIKQRQAPSKVHELVRNGARAANVRFSNVEGLVSASRGSFIMDFALDGLHR